MTTSLADAFIEAGLAQSRGEVRKLAAQGGIAVNGVPLPPREWPSVDRPASSHLLSNGELDLQVGRRRRTWRPVR